MPLVSASIDAFLLTSIITVVPWVYFTLRAPGPVPARPQRDAQAASQSPPQYQQTEPSRRTYISIFIALHSVFILYNVLVCTPQNLFTRLHVPLNEPVDAIRARLLYLGNVVELPRALETLLSRLSSFDVRTIYVRFGHAVVQECEHCSTYYDYTLYALPQPLLGYVREAAVVGLVTMRDSGRERWRMWGLGAVVAGALFEAYKLSTAEVTIPRDGTGVFMWHDTLWLARQLLFLILPPVLHLLPRSQKPMPPLAALPQLTALADQTLARIQLLKYARGAGTRAPELREATAAWWARERQEGGWATEDVDVREMADKLGMGIGEGGEGEEVGRLRVSARMAVDTLKGGFRPSEYL